MTDSPKRPGGASAPGGREGARAALDQARPPRRRITPEEARRSFDEAPIAGEEAATPGGGRHDPRAGAPRSGDGHETRRAEKRRRDEGRRAERADSAAGEPRDGAAGDRFRVDDDGVHRREKDGWLKVCSRLDVLALTRDDANEAWGRLVEIVDPDGARHQWALPAELLASDGREYRSRLLDLGLRIEPGDQAKRALHEYLSRPVPGRARCVPRIGWHGGRFVLPDSVLGPDQGGERLILQTAERLDAAFKVAGDFEAWRAEVATPAEGNSRLTVALAGALAGPLLALLDEEGGGLHWRGGSSLGKTTALNVAASAWGVAIRTWRTTDNSLETTAAGHSDAFLALDELAQVEPKAAGAAAYMLAQGAGKARMGRDGAGRRALTWRLNFQSTGEISLADKLREGGGRAAAGMAVRIIDLPADAGAGLGLFEELHGAASPSAFAERLKAACRRHHGHAARAFVEGLAEDVAAATEAAGAMAARVAGEIAPPDADGQVRRVARRFALIAAAGELATGMGVLPWREGAAVEAARRVLADWLRVRGGTAPAEVIEAERRLRETLEAHGAARFESWTRNTTRAIVMHRLGFVRRAEPLTEDGESGPPEFFLTPTGFREALGGLDPATVAKALIARGVIVAGADGKSAPSLYVPGQARAMRLYHVAPDFLSRAEPGE